MTEFESRLQRDAGIRDADQCRAVAQSLVRQGCGTWEDFLDLGGLFAGGSSAREDSENLRRFLAEAGIPLFIAAKLAAYIKR